VTIRPCIPADVDAILAARLTLLIEHHVEEDAAPSHTRE
jgi:hypothetical protein